MSVVSKYSLALFILLASSSYAYCDTLRCENKLVTEGDTNIEVKLICGEPFDSQVLGIVKINNSYVKRLQYTYVFGSGTLAKILEFHDGKLVKISNGPRM